MKRRFFAIPSAVALALAVNFGLASAHPFADPTPPPGNVDQEGDQHDGQMDESQAADLNEADMNDSGNDGESENASGNAGITVQDQQGQQGEEDRSTEQDGEFEGDS